MTTDNGSPVETIAWKRKMAKSLTLWFGRLHHKDERTRRQAKRVLDSLTPGDKNLVVGLLGYLKSGDSTCRCWAARGLSAIGRGAKDAVPSLIESLGDDDDDCRFWAVAALTSIGPAAKDAAPRLIELLRDRAFGIRQAAAVALGVIDPAAPAVLPALVKAMASDKNPYVRDEIVRTLGRIGTKAAVSELIRALGDDQRDVRRHAAIELKMLGAAAKEAKEALRALVANESDESIRDQANAALRRIRNA